ncbi:MAG: hypothetical protein M0Z42_13205 [Actinomycetota bacterium]|jgi:hypothetical protein|nr:hypothetical protein [Actinomycetota bacterium]
MGVDAALLTVVLVVLAVIFLARHRHGTVGARCFRRAGFGVTVLIAGFFGLFLVGETLSDPGGWEGVGLVALWAIPLALVCLLAWSRPDAAGWVFAPLVALVIGASVSFAVDPNGWRSFESHHGPVRAVIVFAVAVALAVWGLRRTMWAGMMLLVVGILPIVISSLGHDGMASLVAASSAPAITGLLYVAAARLDRRRPPPRADAPSD